MSRTKPNNFPREGLHQPVSHDAVEKLEAERPTLNAGIDYTIGGSVETMVHSSLNAEREAAITIGSRRLQQAANDLWTDFKDEAGPTSRADYIREQQALAARARGQQRTKTPTR